MDFYPLLYTLAQGLFYDVATSISSKTDLEPVLVMRHIVASMLAKDSRSSEAQPRSLHLTTPVKWPYTEIAGHFYMTISHEDITE